MGGRGWGGWDDWKHKERGCEVGLILAWPSRQKLIGVRHCQLMKRAGEGAID